MASATQCNSKQASMLATAMLAMLVVPVYARETNPQDHSSESSGSSAAVRLKQDKVQDEVSSRVPPFTKKAYHFQVKMTYDVGKLAATEGDGEAIALIAMEPVSTDYCRFSSVTAQLDDGTQFVRSTDHESHGRGTLSAEANPNSGNATITVEGEVYCRVVGRNDPPPPNARDLTEEERRLYTSKDGAVDPTDSSFIEKLKQEGLMRREAADRYGKVQKESDWELGLRIHKFMGEHFQYGEPTGSFATTNASVFDDTHRRLVCEQAIIVAAAIFRANGIPFRRLAGACYHPDDGTYDGTSIGHASGEFFCEEQKSWISFDGSVAVCRKGETSAYGRDPSFYGSVFIHFNDYGSCTIGYYPHGPRRYHETDSCDRITYITKSGAKHGGVCFPKVDSEFEEIAIKANDVRPGR